MNRRITATITAVCIGVLFTGCSGNVDTNSEASSSESESETSVSQSDAVETALPEAESASEVNTYYDYIIDLLVEVRSGQADDDTMMTFTETMSPDFMYVSDDAPVFYTTIDIDGNGVDELLLYTKQFDEDGGEAAVIYDAYTVRNGEPVHFIAGGSRNVYYLASDSTFYNMGSSGAAYTGFANYTYADGELILNECYFTDDSTGEVCWYESTDGLWSDDRTEASENDAMSFFDFDPMFIPNELEV